MSRVKAGVRTVPKAHSVVVDAGTRQPGQSWEPKYAWFRTKRQKIRVKRSAIPAYLYIKKKKKKFMQMDKFCFKIFNTSFCFIPFEYFL